MPPAESDVEAARRQLERVLAGPGFSRNERLSRFLRFVVEQHLAGKDAEYAQTAAEFQKRAAIQGPGAPATPGSGAQ